MNQDWTPAAANVLHVGDSAVALTRVGTSFFAVLAHENVVHAEEFAGFDDDLAVRVAVEEWAAPLLAPPDEKSGAARVDGRAAP